MLMAIARPSCTPGERRQLKRSRSLGGGCNGGSSIVSVSALRGTMPGERQTEAAKLNESIGSETNSTLGM